MKNEGWTWGDLAGELMERGIDPDYVSSEAISRNLDWSTPELAAENIWIDTGGE